MLQRVENSNRYAHLSVPKVDGIDAVDQSKFKTVLYEMSRQESVEQEIQRYLQTKPQLEAMGYQVAVHPYLAINPQSMLDQFMGQVGTITATYSNDPMVDPHLRGRTVTLHASIAMEVKLGLLHKSKYYDFLDTDEKLRKLLEAASTADYAGMSNAEKALAI